MHIEIYVIQHRAVVPALRYVAERYYGFRLNGSHGNQCAADASCLTVGASAIASAILRSSFSQLYVIGLMVTSWASSSEFMADTWRLSKSFWKKNIEAPLRADDRLELDKVIVK